MAVRRFGFGFVGGTNIASYGADLFFNFYFLTPPFPSTIQITLNNGIGELPGYQDIVLRLMDLAAPYPNIKMGINVAFDALNPTEWATFITWLDTLRAKPSWQSVGFIGYAWEQMPNYTPAQSMQAQAMASQAVTSRGWEFICYYPQGYNGTDFSAWPFMDHTNYPQGDNAGTLDPDLRFPNIVGITHGTDGHQIFPQIGCNFQGMPNWSTVHFANGYLAPGCTTCTPCNNVVDPNGFPPTIQQALARDGANPISFRQWDFFVAGHSGTQNADGFPSAPFIGVSGISTDLLMDHPVFRQEMTNWIVAHPSVFLQGKPSGIKSAALTITVT